MGERLYSYKLHKLNNRSFKKILFIYLFWIEGREGERKGEKHQCVVASQAPPTGDLAHSPGMCSDWELNLRPFGLQASTLATEPQQPGPQVKVLME